MMFWMYFAASEMSSQRFRLFSKITETIFVLNRFQRFFKIHVYDLPPMGQQVSNLIVHLHVHALPCMQTYHIEFDIFIHFRGKQSPPTSISITSKIAVIF